MDSSPLCSGRGLFLGLRTTDPICRRIFLSWDLAAWDQTWGPPPCFLNCEWEAMLASWTWGDQLGSSPKSLHLLSARRLYSPTHHPLSGGRIPTISDLNFASEASQFWGLVGGFKPYVPSSDSDPSSIWQAWRWPVDRGRPLSPCLCPHWAWQMATLPYDTLLVEI